ncbi:MAG: ACT domain-containing protein [Desulfobacterales bacterium]|nr:ACT domain-containing protein [Desulfobacterales bacterium]
MKPLELVIMQGRYTIHRLDKNKDIPDTVSDSSFYSVTRTDDELSVVCESALIVPADQSESGWSCLKVQGVLEFSLTGILAELSGCLARAGVSIFAVSTYNTDYILVKTQALADATAVLSAAGHKIIRTRDKDKPDPPPVSPIAETPEPPYYAVIFTSVRTNGNEGYKKTAEEMVALAKEQPGFLGVESARDGLGITVSYWSDLKAIQDWKANADHRIAQKKGKEDWYSGYKIRISKVEREYGWK